MCDLALYIIFECYLQCTSVAIKTSAVFEMFRDIWSCESLKWKYYYSTRVGAAKFLLLQNTAMYKETMIFERFLEACLSE